ncbi:MAG: uroporphyrinogen decarboxylase family protein [bacterium]
MTSIERTCAVISGKPVDRLPVQPMLMTYASRCAGIPYGEYCHDGSKMAAAQLKAMQDFDLDILLTCSDPAREVVDLAGEGSVRWFPDQPPAIDEENAALKNKAMLSRLRKPVPASKGRMGDRVKAIKMMRQQAGPGAVIIGWVEGALALGAELRGVNRIMLDLVDDPDFVDELFDFAADLAIEFARVQIEAGADSIGMSDAAASMIGPKYYERFLWPKQRRILSAIREMGAMARLHMCGRTDPLLESMKKLPVDVYEIDYMTNIIQARESLGATAVICGNISTIETLLNGNEQDVQAEATRRHKICGRYHIISPGCEVAPMTPDENIRALVQYSKQALDLL